jgi:hypothetical protein
MYFANYIHSYSFLSSCIIPNYSLATKHQIAGCCLPCRQKIYLEKNYAEDILRRIVTCDYAVPIYIIYLIYLIRPYN